MFLQVFELVYVCDAEFPVCTSDLHLKPETHKPFKEMTTPENTKAISFFSTSRVIVGVELVNRQTVLAGKEWCWWWWSGGWGGVCR